MAATHEALKKLKGKKVCIICKSDYDQVSNQLVISERIEGIIDEVYEEGIGMKNMVRKKYVNNMFHGNIPIPSNNGIIFFNMVESIYIL